MIVTSFKPIVCLTVAPGLACGSRIGCWAIAIDASRAPANAAKAALDRVNGSGFGISSPPFDFRIEKDIATGVRSPHVMWQPDPQCGKWRPDPISGDHVQPFLFFEIVASR